MLAEPTMAKENNREELITKLLLEVFEEFNKEVRKFVDSNNPHCPNIYNHNKAMLAYRILRFDETIDIRPEAPEHTENILRIKLNLPKLCHECREPNHRCLCNQEVLPPG